ncbi:hypothetical protein Dimus_025307 [Dionaea muscipula]
MAENNESTGFDGGESLVDKIAEKFHGDDDSSSSSSSSSLSSCDSEVKETVAPVGSKVKRLFGRQKPIHQVLGGGKPADVLLWRNKAASATVLTTATVIWILFVIVEYHLLTLVAQILIFSIAVLFLLSKATTFIKKSPPRIPKFELPQEPLLEFAAALTGGFNRGFAVLREIASGRDLKKFLTVIAGLWLLSVVGSCFNFLTLLYITLVVLHTVPVLYDKYEDNVDSCAEFATIEFKKHYSFVSENYLSKMRSLLRG